MRQVVGEPDRMGGYMSGVFGTVPMPMVSGPNLVLAQMTPPPGSLAGPGAFPSMPGHPSLAGMQPTPHPSLAGQSAGSLPGVGSNPSLSGTGPGSPPPSTLGLAAGQAPPHRQRWPIAVAVGSVLGAVVVGVVLLITVGKPPPPPPIVPPPPPKTQTPPPEPAMAKKLVRWAVSSQPAG